ncbi:MAG: hypothetical protein AABY93_02925 [Bacteroidota bacterium]
MRLTVQLLGIILFFLAFLFEVSGQVTVLEFLRSAKDDPEIKLFEEQLNYLQQKPYKLSALQKLEFRTRSNQLDPTRQDYAIRLNPANPWQVRNNNSYFKEYQLVLASKKSIVLKEVLAARYQLVNNFMYYREFKMLAEEDKNLSEAALTVLGKQQFFDSFKGDDYVKLNLEQMNKTVIWEEASFEMDNQLGRIAQKYPAAFDQNLEWDYQRIITVDMIENAVDSLINEEGSITTLAYQEGKVNLANKQFELEKSNINVGFLQTQYEPYRIEQDRKPWNISLGVTIPITNPNKEDMTKRKLDVIEAQYDLVEKKSEVQLQKFVQYRSLKNQIVRYRLIKSKIDELKNSTLAKTLTEIKSSNPLAAIQFNGNILKLQGIALKLRQNINATYVEFLGSTDRLQQSPIVNYFSTDFEEIGF